MKKVFKKIPQFKSEDQERTFWATHDSTEYVDWSKAQSVIFPNLKPSTQTISLRLPASMLHSLKTIAHKHDIPYQSYVKMIIAEKIKTEV